MASHGTDQTIVQRLLAARNEKDGRKALLASGIVILIQFALFLLVGVLLFVFSQHTPLLAAGERPDRILPLFLVRKMPVGLAGMLLASIIAVAMSNASGSLNSLAASSILDFSGAAGHRQDPQKLLRLSRRMTLFWGVVLMAFGFVPWGSLLETGLTVASFPLGSLLGLFLLGKNERGSKRQTFGTGPRAWPVGFGGDCRRHDDRNRHFPEASGDGARGTVRLSSVRRVGRRRGALDVRCAFVCRVGRGDSRSGRRI